MRNNRLLFLLCRFSLAFLAGAPCIQPALCASVFNRAAVVASTPEAAEAGVSILQRGGNAADAAAAVAFSLMVTDPAMTSLGGRSQILIHLKGGKLVGLDGASLTPGVLTEPARTGQGYKTCAIPGSPAAIEEMVARFGRLPLKTVMQPAIELAKNGFVVNSQYHQYFHGNAQHFRLYPGTARHFLKEDGTAYSKGEIFRQPALARALELIAEEGAGAVYRGKIAKAIIDDMMNNGGLIREEDLARYRVLPGEIVEGSYRGHRIVSRGDQCDGASVIEMLQILEHFPLSTYQPADAKLLHLMAQSIYLGHMDEELADWKQVSKALAFGRSREIDENKALPVPAMPKSQANEGETTHFSVVDEEGNAVAYTQSIGPTFGTKVANPEFGFIYAYSYDMNDNPVPYKRDKTSQSPTMVFEGDTPFLVLGSAGSSRIPPSIVQVIVNVIDHKMPLDRAVESPRLFPTDTELRLEYIGLSGATLTRLGELGYKIRLYSQLDNYFGRVHAILRNTQTGKIHAAFDPRGYGGAAGF